MGKDIRVELTEERVRKIVREEVAKVVMDMVSRSLKARIKAMNTIERLA